MVHADFWSNKKVFITGHTGFKGCWLSLWLYSLGAQITGYALDPFLDPNLFSALTIGNYINDNRSDICNFSSLKSVIKSSEPEIVIHMAAQSLVRESYMDPVQTYATNVMGTVNLLQVARSCDSVRVILIITSDKCYENKEIDYAYTESDPIGGHDPYSSSKGCVEVVTSAFRRSFFETGSLVAIASARAGNVIGGGDWAVDRIIPDAMRAFRGKETLRVRNPSAIRPWQHVLEPLSGYMTLCENMWDHPPEFSDSWNFGPENEDVRTVEEVIDRVSELWGGNAGWKKSNGEHPHEAILLKLDITKAKEKLGWVPKWNLDKALKKTVSWYKCYYGGEDILEISLEQIKEYQAS